MLKLTMLIFVASLTVLVSSLPNPEPVHREPKPGHCHDFGIDIKEGERVSAPIGYCLHLTCRDAAKNDVSAASCGLIAAPKKQGCTLKPEDVVTPYPDCCGRVICDDDN